MSRRILVVDNDRITRATFRQFLELGGYEISEAASGAADQGSGRRGTTRDLVAARLGHQSRGLAVLSNMVSAAAEIRVHLP